MDELDPRGSKPHIHELLVRCMYVLWIYHVSITTTDCANVRCQFCIRKVIENVSINFSLHPGVFTFSTFSSFCFFFFFFLENLKTRRSSRQQLCLCIDANSELDFLTKWISERNNFVSRIVSRIFTCSVILIFAFRGRRESHNCYWRLDWSNHIQSSTKCSNEKKIASNRGFVINGRFCSSRSNWWWTFTIFEKEISTFLIIIVKSSSKEMNSWL